MEMPRRKKTTAISDTIEVGLLNGEAAAGPSNQSSRKRKRANLAEDKNASKRIATENNPPPPNINKPSKLNRPQIYVRINEQKRGQDIFAAPSSPEASRRKTRKRGTFSSNQQPMGEEGEEGEEGAANALMTSPAFRTRSYDKNTTRNAADTSRKTSRVNQTRKQRQPLNSPTSSGKHEKPSGEKSARNTNSHRIPAKMSTIGRSTVPVARQTAQESEPDQDQVAKDRKEETVAKNVQHPPLKRNPQKRGPRKQAQRLANGIGDEGTAVEHHEDPGEPDSNYVPPEADEVEASGSAAQIYEMASSVYNCKKYWDRLLEAARTYHEDSAKSKLDHTRDILRLISAIKEAYTSMRSDPAADTEVLNRKVDGYIVRLAESVRHTRQTGVTKTDRSQINEIYLSIIPSLAFLLKKTLITRLSNGALGALARAELVSILKPSIRLCEIASYWNLRPSFEVGVLRGTRTAIKPTLVTLSEIYRDPPLSAAEIEEQERIKQQRRDEVRAYDEAVEARERMIKRSAEQAIRERREIAALQMMPRTNVIDIDDIDLNETRRIKSSSKPATVSGNGIGAHKPSLPPVFNQSDPRMDDRMAREQTEDIPGPTGHEWADEEDATLIAGLERFTGRNRFLEIADEYGAKGGALEARDVDEMMQRAAYYKQSMLSRIKKPEQWTWLLSVDS
jgi:hypothetical protein